MELMQRCLPFKWQKYWNCGLREFDLLMILQDIDNLKLTVQDRLLLTLLARIWTGKENSLAEIMEAADALDHEQRLILSEWMEEQHFCEISPAQASTACPCTPARFDPPPLSAHRGK
jgi:hypothetical protein